MNALRLVAVTLFHPIVGFNYMKKDRSKFNWKPVVIILALLAFTKIFSLYFTHYPLAGQKIQNVNIFVECAVIIVPLLSWVIASYAITTIMSGEVKLTECLMACCYSMIPYIIITIPLTVATNIMSNGDVTIYNFFNSIAWGMILIYMVVNLKVMNNYTVAKTALVILLSLFTMVILWATVFLFYALSMRFVSFVSEVITEIQFRFYY